MIPGHTAGATGATGAAGRIVPGRQRSALSEPSMTDWPEPATHHIPFEITGWHSVPHSA